MSKRQKSSFIIFMKERGSKIDIFVYTIDEDDKVPYVSYLLSKIWERRYVCFCPDMKTARQLYTLNPLGSCCASSCTKNNKNLRSFNTYNHDHLFVTKKLNADADYKDVECLVFFNPDATPYTVQKFAKNLCSANPKVYFFTHGTEECGNAYYLSGLIGCNSLTRFRFTRGILNKK